MRTDWSIDTHRNVIGLQDMLIKRIAHAMQSLEFKVSVRTHGHY